MKVSSNRRIVGCAIKEKSSLGMCEWENGIEEFCWEIFTLNPTIEVGLLRILLSRDGRVERYEQDFIGIEILKDL